jgi:hypothetical protein
LIRRRHTFLTVGVFGLVVGGILLALGIVGLYFGTQNADVFTAVCPPAVLLPSAFVAFVGLRLTIRHGRLKGLAGMLLGKRSLTVAEIAASLRVSEVTATRLAVMLIAEGYADAVFDPAAGTLRKKDGGS